MKYQETLMLLCGNGNHKTKAACKVSHTGQCQFSLLLYKLCMCISCELECTWIGGACLWVTLLHQQDWPC
jgi:hypothetical protein